MVARLVLAESEDIAILVEVRRGGGAASWPGAARAPRLPAALLGAGRSRRLAPGHCPRPLPLLQVHNVNTASSPLTLSLHKYCARDRYNALEYKFLYRDSDSSEDVD